MIVKVLRETTAVLVVAALGVGCGARAAPPTDRVWVANARGVVDQLRGDVVTVAAYDRLGTARQGLRDDSQLYGLLVPYTDFGGCRHMVTAVGVEPPGRAQAVRLLHRACLHLQRADELFTRAVAHRAARLLVDATQEAIGAVPSLEAAALELARSA
ncbi:MAG: hypothetical protein JWO17_2620 [Actinomycetia bacterium]|nr:hypothetical protein [Actinomycetes bacterium]